MEMEIEISEINGIKIAEIISDSVLITKTQDALDIMAESNYRESWKIILYAKNILPAFFDLKTGIAGDILQKFSTYNVQLAIVGDFSKYPGRSLKDFIFESNRLGRINFVSSTKEAKERLSRNSPGPVSGGFI
ncbi:MAG: DUF4180 domain-containing protein [Bacteroidota bacterium]